ncbi:MAG: hypothetical protein K1X90_12685 [Candidatus Kapabacteria bacterium]|nr:hypothetical protein [Candidatus Kapabacteria bacterium]
MTGSTQCLPPCTALWRQWLFALLPLWLLASGVLPAQTIVNVGNPYIQANITKQQKSGKFWITAGPEGNTTRFLFRGSEQITSHVVFRIDQPGQSPRFFCNVPSPWMNPRPKYQGQDIPFIPYDSLYQSPDTAMVIWKNVGGYEVKMRWVPEKRLTPYDNGADMLIEWQYEKKAFNNVTLSIVLMLDGVNSDATNLSGGAGDQSSILTSDGYFPVNVAGKRFGNTNDNTDRIPDFYHIGNFIYSQPLNTIYPIHRLRGTSHNGTPLTTPSLFAISDWQHLWDVAWDLPPAVGNSSMVDCATFARWENLAGSGTVRTAFGLNNKAGNDLYTCRDSILFVDIRAKRLVTQKVKNGPYTPNQVRVDMWITNLNTQFDIAPEIRLQVPIQSSPNGTQRLTLDPSTPAKQYIQLQERSTGKLTWLLNIDPASTDTLVRLRFYQKPATNKAEKLFRDGCEPLVTVIGFQDPPANPPPDTLAPILEATGSGRAETAYWNFRTYDRHLGFNYDSGIDSIQIVRNDNGNFKLDIAPPNFNRCDTNVTLNMVASVVDTAKPGHLEFCVFDCKGNRVCDTVIYSPRPDIFTPTIDSIYAPYVVPFCNARVYEVFLSDSINQEPSAGDNGFGTIEVVGTPINFTPVEINFDRGGAAVQPFDKRATFRTSVVDSMQDGSIRIRVADFAGNDTILTFTYCTRPDTLPPVGKVVPIGTTGQQWQLEASDSAAWDRGLQELAVLSNLNNNITFNGQDPASVAWPVVPGMRSFMGLGTFQVVDDKNDAELVLVIRDTYYGSDPARHADTVTMRFRGTPDTLAPNFTDATFAPDPGSSGMVADIEVNDIHYLSNNDLYPYDLGLATIAVDPARTTPNMRVRPLRPIAFSAGDARTTFQIEVLDTLASTIRDSICFQATDLAGNTSTRCYYYPVVPDSRSPIFVGQLSSDRSSLTGIATDSRPYDRGLGSVTIENPVNLDPGFSLTNLRGAASASVLVAVVDPNKPVSGTLVIRDVIGDATTSPELTAIHIRRIPFYLPTSGFALKLPPVVEGEIEFDAPIIVTDSFPGGAVSSVVFDVEYSGLISYVGARNATATATVTPAGAGVLKMDVRMANRLYKVGDTVAVLRFATLKSTEVTEFRVTLVPGAQAVNAGAGTTFTDAAANDTATSVVMLPATFFKPSSDSVGYHNGNCERVLATTGGNLKATGLALLRISPQPAGLSGGRTLQLMIRELPASGARLELVAADGSLVETIRLEQAAGETVAGVEFTLPPTIAPGIYFLRLTGATGVDWGKVIVTE